MFVAENFLGKGGWIKKKETSNQASFVNKINLV